jgi:hypothetical protein
MDGYKLVASPHIAQEAIHTQTHSTRIHQGPNSFQEFPFERSCSCLCSVKVFVSENASEVSLN